MIFNPFLAVLSASTLVLAAGSAPPTSSTKAAAPPAASASHAAAAAPPPPAGFNTSNPVLTDKNIPFNQIPFQADTSDEAPRGAQAGYNRCNSTTSGPNSLCQTLIVNDVTDFCLWGPPASNSTIADTEALEVAWCTKGEKWGTRTIPAGTLTGVQFVYTPSYVQMTGYINQEYINIQDGDYGGELDAHGDDQRGNPIGALVYTTGFAGSNGQEQQAIQWTMFIGSNTFCFKACNPANPQAPLLCQHIYDRIGCNYNVPSTNPDGVFESCLGEDMSPPGIYVSNGETITYHQPAESLGPITSVPYTPVVPASSQCTTYQSSALYPSLPTPTITLMTSTAGATPTANLTGGTTEAPTDAANSASTVGHTGLLVSAAAVLLGLVFLA